MADYPLPAPRIGENQPEIEALQSYLALAGWSLVARFEELHPGDPVGRRVIWRCLHVSGRACRSRICNAPGALAACLREELEREPGLVDDLMEILDACGWRHEQQANEQVLILDQPESVREALMRLLDPDAPERVAPDGTRLAPIAEAAENLQMLVPGCTGTVYVLRERAGWPYGLAARGAGAQVRAVSLPEAVIRAYDRVACFDPWWSDDHHDGI